MNPKYSGLVSLRACYNGNGEYTFFVSKVQVIKETQKQLKISIRGFERTIKKDELNTIGTGVSEFEVIGDNLENAKNGLIAELNNRMQKHSAEINKLAEMERGLENLDVD